MIIDVNKKFGVNAGVFKAGGRIMVIPEKEHIVDGKKMADIREYMSDHSEELEEDDNI